VTKIVINKHDVMYFIMTTWLRWLSVVLSGLVQSSFLTHTWKDHDHDRSVKFQNHEKAGPDYWGPVHVDTTPRTGPVITSLRLD
jgi:hypothetical protein